MMKLTSILLLFVMTLLLIGCDNNQYFEAVYSKVIHNNTSTKQYSSNHDFINFYKSGDFSIVSNYHKVLSGYQIVSSYYSIPQITNYMGKYYKDDRTIKLEWEFEGIEFDKTFQIDGNQIYITYEDSDDKREMYQILDDDYINLDGDYTYNFTMSDLQSVVNPLKIYMLSIEYKSYSFIDINNVITYSGRLGLGPDDGLIRDLELLEYGDPLLIKKTISGVSLSIGRMGLYYITLYYDRVMP